MSFTTALQSLRLTAARSVASAQPHRVAVAASASSVAGQSSSSGVQARQCTSAARAAGRATAAPHAPHGHLDQGSAGPSRCFCTSHRRRKASELPSEELHYQSSLDSYRHDQLSTTHDFWQPSDDSTSLVPAKRLSGPAKHHSVLSAPPIRGLFANHPDESIADDSSYSDFFTPSVRQTAEPDVAVNASRPSVFLRPTSCPSYIESLDLRQREAYDARVRLLIRSGERSLPSLCATYGQVDPQQREQICCHIMSYCVKESQDARIVWDLYRSWTTILPIRIADPGSTLTMIRRMHGDTLYRCATYLQAAGLPRQAATVAGDVRLRPSQSRYLLEQFIYDLKLPRTPSFASPDFTLDSSSSSSWSTPTAATAHHSKDGFAAADARLAVREMCDAMINLMADGVSFKRKTLNRIFKLLCLTRARSRVVRLLRTAQRRAQIDALRSKTDKHASRASELRAAGGFSRLRAEQDKPPQVVSTKVTEDTIRLLCAQDSSGARAAYEILSALDPTQRTAGMYDALMTVYGNAAVTNRGNASTKAHSSIGYTSVDEQLWHDVCTLPHVGGPTLHTMSARIVCHTRKRRYDLIKSDLDFVRSSRLGSIHDLNENAKLSIVRCCIETGSLLAAFRHASTLLAAAIAVGDESFQSRMISTLLRAAQHIQIVSAPTPADSPRSSSPSRAQLLKRFLRHFSHLHRKFPALHPDMQTLSLFIQLLRRHQAWIETSTLWNMLRLVGGHFHKDDTRLVKVLEAFVEVFESRGERCSAQELRGLVVKLRQERPGEEAVERKRAK